MHTDVDSTKGKCSYALSQQPRSLTLYLLIYGPPSTLAPPPQANLSQVMETVTAALHAVLHAENAYLFIMDTPRGELWMQSKLHGREEFLSVR